MGWIDDLKRHQEEKNKRQTEELVDAFGGPDGCLKTLFLPFIFPFLIAFEIVKFIVNLTLQLALYVFGVLFSILIILHSLFILTPLKIFFFIISFGYWNGFKKRNISERLVDFWNWLNGIRV